MARLRGRTLRDTAAVRQSRTDTGNHHHQRSATPVRHDRTMVLDGPMNAEAFRAYVVKILVPTLRPYSPDMNPIENSFSRLKAILRKADARTVDDLWIVIGNALPTFTPGQCAAYFTAAGYEPDRSDLALDPR